MSIMIQVNTTNEQQKSGISPDGLLDIIEFVLSECPKLKIVGLMTIGKFGDPSPEYFKTLVDCKGMVLDKFKDHFDEKEFELSMGMSADYLSAIEMGSTNVRIGSTIFGARPPKNANVDAPKVQNVNEVVNQGDNEEKKEDQ